MKSSPRLVHPLRYARGFQANGVLPTERPWCLRDDLKGPRGSSGRLDAKASGGPTEALHGGLRGVNGSEFRAVSPPWQRSDIILGIRGSITGTVGMQHRPTFDLDASCNRCR